MTTFVDRLLQAAKHAGIEETQAAIAATVGVNKQTVWRWFREGIEPSADNCFEIAAKLGVDARWLKSGEGEMLPKPSDDLPQDVREIVREVLRATPQRRRMVLNMVRALKKAVVVVAVGIPPLLAPQQADAGGILHKYFCATGLNTHWRRFLKGLFTAVQRDGALDLT